MVSSRVPAPSLPRRLICLLGAGLALLLLSGAEEAGARPNRSYDSYRGKGTQLRSSRAAEKAKEKPAPPQPVHLIVISIRKQRISVYGSGGYHAQSVVSTGMSGYPTPVGVFSVIEKDRYHHSTIYSGAPMPYMQRITWSGVAMHEGVLPGYPASHGCIRLTHQFASTLWGMTRMGVRVVVTPDDSEPAPLVHANLPTPTLTPAPASVTETEQIKPSLVAMSGTKTADGGAPPTAVKLLSPLDRAKAEKAQMIAEAPAKAKAAKEAAGVAAAKGLEANKAISALREADNAVAAARASLASAVAAVAQAKTPEATERAKAEQSAAETKLAEASRLATEAGNAESAATQEALAAATAAWEAEKASDLAAQASRAGERNTEPISIFVSKKTGRIYVRQAWRPLYEAPATIKDPASPLGTHVYVAVETKEDNSAMRWVSITYPQTTSGPDAKRPPQQHRSRRGDRSEPAAEPAARPHETAAGALDRVALNEETKRFIADRLWVGASIIVSDYGLSDEAGKYTDFIVQPR